MLPSSSVIHSLCVVIITPDARFHDIGHLVHELDLHGRVHMRLRFLDGQHVLRAHEVTKVQHHGRNIRDHG